MEKRTAGPPNPAVAFNQALRDRDETSSFHNLLAAAQNGCLRAQFLVGLAYHVGRGVAVDYSQAGKWYQRAAAGGDSNAMTNLGVMNLLGQGVAADELEAYTWLQSALGLGHDWLRPALELLERRVTSSGDTGDTARILAQVAPEIPSLGPCTRGKCDLSRCNVAD